MWTERLLEATGWTDQRLTLSWDAVESVLETQLPGDYKHLCEAFGKGRFCGAYSLYSVGDGKSADVLMSWRVELRYAPEPGSAEERDSDYAPYAIYRPGGTGLIPWGYGETGQKFFWLADSESPDGWPTLARWSDDWDAEWNRFDMSASEFMGRAVLDPEFGSFGLADLVPQPFFMTWPAGKLAE
ncbi:hypothetical protein ACH4E8_01890 [Streptomyces sp. NPDC017979]|uniref:hypothetical protein n=1 Tax=Streptomyces sp. NPDC017979 TaxID=3365024 RepID=UPI0037B0FC09